MWLLWLLVKLEMFDKNCQHTHTTGYLSIVCTNVVIFLYINFHMYSINWFKCSCLNWTEDTHLVTWYILQDVWNPPEPWKHWTMIQYWRDHEDWIQLLQYLRESSWKNFIHCKLNRTWIQRPFTLLLHLTTLLYPSAIVVIPQEIFPDNWHGRC